MKQENKDAQFYSDHCEGQLNLKEAVLYERKKTVFDETRGEPEYATISIQSNIVS